MDKDLTISNLRDVTSYLLENNVLDGARWKIREHGVWKNQHWIGWVSLETDKVLLDWALSAKGSLLEDQEPWLSVRLKKKSKFSLYSWCVIGLYNVDPMTKEQGPWWEELNKLHLDMRTVAESLEEPIKTPESIPAPEAKPEDPGHSISIDLLRKNFG